MSFAVTHHAITRYIERIEPCSRAEAHRRIRAHARAIELAIAFGAHTVRTGDGAKLILAGIGRVRVVSVYPRHWISRSDLPRRDPRYLNPAAEWSPSAPACCGRCGLSSANPVTGACIRTDCALANGRRAALVMEEVQP